MIELYTVMMMVCGYLAHQSFMLSVITQKKGRIVTPMWYARNRPYKVVQSVISSCIGTFLAYIWYEPHSITDNQDLTIYLAMIFAIGAGADFIADRTGKKTYEIKNPDEIVDDGRTIFRGKDE